MALAQFRDEIRKVEISKRLGAPKKATYEAWFKEIRKVIPEIPNPKRSDWQITHQEATKDSVWIKFTMQNSIGERAYIVVDRRIPHIGSA